MGRDVEEGQVLAGHPGSPGREKQSLTGRHISTKRSPQGLALGRVQINKQGGREKTQREGRRGGGPGREGRLKAVGIFLPPQSSKNRVPDRHRMKQSCVYLKILLAIQDLTEQTRRVMDMKEGTSWDELWVL